MLTLSFRYRFEAGHRLCLSQESRCTTPHGHSWHATVHLEAQAIGTDGKVEDFDRLKHPWKTFLQETVDHSFLYHHQDPILEGFQEHIPEMRGLPCPSDPTTENVAKLFYEKAVALYARAFPSLRVHSVTVEETVVNHVTYSPSKEDCEPSAFTGWWRSDDPGSREFLPA